MIKSRSTRDETHAKVVTLPRNASTSAEVKSIGRPGPQLGSRCGNDGPRQLDWTFHNAKGSRPTNVRVVRVMETAAHHGFLGPALDLGRRTQQFDDPGLVANRVEVGVFVRPILEVGSYLEALAEKR